MTKVLAEITTVDDDGAKVVPIEQPKLVKKSKLKAVAPQTVAPKKPKILISGAPNVRKTWESLSFPNSYYFDIEGGATRDNYQKRLKESGGEYFGQAQGSLEFETVIDEVKLLSTEDHNYKTAVFDSISKLYYDEISRESEKLGDKDAYGASKKPAVGYMRRLLRWANRLDMTVILIAHTKALWGLDGKGQRSEIGTTFDAWDKLEYELDLWLEIYKQGGSFYARVKKTRIEAFPFNETFPWNYEEFSQRYGKDIMEKKSEAIHLATEQQIEEIKDLLSRIKIDEKQIDKWLTTANVDKFEEMESKTIASLITHIKSKATQGDK